jgi:hypothetical protein
MTTTNNNKDNNGSRNEEDMTMKESTGRTNHTQGGKGTEKNNAEEQNKSKLTVAMDKKGWIRQDETKCAAAGACKAVEGMPLATHHRCAICSFCLHEDCGVELKETEKHKVTSTSHKAICFACIDTIQAGRLLKLDKISGTQFISLGQYKVFKSIRNEYAPLKLINPVPFSSSSEESDSDDSSIEEVPKPTTATGNKPTTATANKSKPTTSITTKHKTNNNTSPPKDVPDKIEMEDNNTDQDDATVDAGNSNETPLSSTPKNASTTISKNTWMSRSSSKQPTQSTPSTHAGTVANPGSDEIQQIEPSFKLHPVDPDNQNQTILHAIKDFPQDLTDLKVFFKNTRPMMKGGMLYLKILASFEGEPDQLLSKVI